MGLVDYNKAFDSVVIPEVIDALKKQGVELVYVNVLQHIYKYAKSYIRFHKTPNDSDCEGEYDKVILVLANCSLPSWKRYFANYDRKRGESKSIVNISVTYGSPMTILFLPTVWKNFKKCHTN